MSRFVIDDFLTQYDFTIRRGKRAMMGEYYKLCFKRSMKLQDIQKAKRNIIKNQEIIERLEKEINNKNLKEQYISLLKDIRDGK